MFSVPCKYFLRFLCGNLILKFHRHGIRKHSWESIWGPYEKIATPHPALIPESKMPHNLPFYLPNISASPSVLSHSCTSPGRKNNVEIDMAHMLYQQTPTLPYPLLTSAFFMYCHLSIILPHHVLLWMQVLLAPTCHVLCVRKATCIPVVLYK